MVVRVLLLGLLSMVLMAALCPTIPPSNGALFRDQTALFEGEMRTYHFYEDRSTEGPRPLVLLLHGGGGVIDNHIGLGTTRWPHQIWLDIADEEGLHLLVPQGLNSHWNDCRTDCTNCGDQDDVGFLLWLIEDLSTRYEIDSTRIYAIGESNGGLMTLRLAQERPDRFAGMGVVIALMPENTGCDPQDLPISLMFQIGTDDDTVPHEGGMSSSAMTGSFHSAEDSLDYWLNLNQCSETPRVTNLPDINADDATTVMRQDFDCSATGTDVSVLHINGGGHVPPSIEVQVSDLLEALVGEQNHDIEGAREFWEFLREYRRQ